MDGRYSRCVYDILHQRAHRVRRTWRRVAPAYWETCRGFLVHPETDCLQYAR
nr:MAG TPA: hypothetical protein [Caudoviricetes sp.]